jgi:hypothetical protein
VTECAAQRRRVRPEASTLRSAACFPSPCCFSLRLLTPFSSPSFGTQVLLKIRRDISRDISRDIYRVIRNTQNAVPWRTLAHGRYINLTPWPSKMSDKTLVLNALPKLLAKKSVIIPRINGLRVKIGFVIWLRLGSFLERSFVFNGNWLRSVKQSILCAAPLLQRRDHRRRASRSPLGGWTSLTGITLRKWSQRGWSSSSSWKNGCAYFDRRVRSSSDGKSIRRATKWRNDG